jgi:hypothetical protein
MENSSSVCAMALRHVGMPLDITKFELCKLLSEGALEETVREAAQHVGLIVARLGDERYLERPSVKSFARDLVSVLIAG